MGIAKCAMSVAAFVTKFILFYCLNMFMPTTMKTEVTAALVMKTETEEPLTVRLMADKDGQMSPWRLPCIGFCVCATSHSDCPCCGPYLCTGGPICTNQNLEK